MIAGAHVRAEIEFSPSRTRRVADRILASVGYASKIRMSRQIGKMAAIPGARDVLASHGLAHISFDAHMPHELPLVPRRNWNNVLETLGILPTETEGISVKERVVDGVSHVMHAVDQSLDRVSESLVPDMAKIRTIYEHGIRTSEDFEVLSRAGGPNKGYSSLSLMGGFALGINGTMVISALAGVVTPVSVAILALGVTGAFALAHCPSFRDRTIAIFKGAIPLTIAALAMHIGRTQFGLCGKELLTLLTGFSAMMATYIGQGIYDSVKQRQRLHQLAVENAHLVAQQRYSFEILENLYKVKDSRPEKIAKEVIEAKVKLLDLRAEIPHLAHVMDAAQIASLNSQITLALAAIAHRAVPGTLDSAIEKISTGLDAIKIPEFHLPNQPLIVATKVARMLNLVFLLLLQPIFFTKAQGPASSMLFAGFYTASAFYTYGAFSYMGTVEQAERGETLKFPKVDPDKSKRSSIMMFRYTAPGGFAGENPLECLIQDIFAKIIYGPYKVIFRNAAAWTCKGQTFGYVKTAHIFEGRIAAIRRLIDNIPTLKALSEETRNHMAFSLSIEERPWLAHRVMDDVASEAYDNSPAEGQIVRFRDSIGRWHGERAALRTLKAIFEERLAAAVADPSLLGKYRTVLSTLKESILDHRDITLDNLHSKDALIAAIKRMDEKHVLSDAEINFLVAQVIEPYREQYLAKALRYFALEASIDTRRAYQISRRAAQRLATERRMDPIAKLGKDLILLRKQMPAADQTKLADLLVTEYGIANSDATQLVKDIRTAPVQESAKGDARIYRENVDLYYRLRDQYEFGRALEAGEDGMVSKTLLWLAGQPGTCPPLTPGQKDLKDAFMEFKAWAVKTAADPASTHPLRKPILAYAKGIHADPKSFTDLQWAQFIDNYITVEKETSTGRLLAKKIEYGASVRRFEGLGGANAEQRANLSRTIAEEICIVLSKKKLFGTDWAARVNAEMAADPDLSFEGAQHKIWSAWKNSIQTDVEATARYRGLNDLEVAFVWEITEMELDRNRKEIDTGTFGMHQIACHETEGVRTASARIVADYANPRSVARRCLDAAAKLKDQRKIVVASLTKGIIIPKKTIDKVTDIINRTFDPIKTEIAKIAPAKHDTLIDEMLKIKGAKALAANPKLLDKIRTDLGYPLANALLANPDIFNLGTIIGKSGMTELIKTMLDSTKTKASAVAALIVVLQKTITDEISKKITVLISKGLGGKGKPATKGWVKSFEELTRTIPQILLGQGSLTIEFEGETYEIGDSRVKTFSGNLAFGTAQKDLEELTKIECNLLEEGIRLREWVGGLRDVDPAPGERGRTLEKDSLKPFADKVMAAAKTGLTAAALAVALDKIPPDVVIAHMTPLNFMAINKGRLSKTFEEIQKGLGNGSITKRTGANLDVTHYFSQKVGYLDYTVGKAALTNVALLGATIGEQLGVFLRYCIKHYLEEMGGQTRIPVKIHNLIKEDVVRQIRLHADEDKDYHAKLERGITPDDIARTLMDYIYDKKMTPKKAAKRVFAEMKLVPQEIDRTEAYCEGTISEIEDNLVDIASEIAICTFASQAVGIAAAFNEAKRGRVPDPTHEYTKLLAANGGAGGSLSAVIDLYLKKHTSLNFIQKKEIRRIAADAYRKLCADEKRPPSEKLYKSPWYTVPALWTPRDEKNVRREFLMLDTMRHELIIPRARTMEEIVSWSASQQGMMDCELDEGRILEFAVMARRIAKVADTLAVARKPSKFLKIAGFTGHDKNDLVACREAFIRDLSCELQRREEEPDFPEKIINYLDDGRYERTYFEMQECDFHGNWDLDNITSYRFPFLSAHFGYHHGILVYRGDALLQFGNNYEYQGNGPFIQAEQDKDETLRDNMWGARSQKAPRGIVRYRSKRLKKTAFPIGYQNLMPVDTVMECVTTIESVNFTTRDKGTYWETFYGKLSKKQFFGALQRATLIGPILAAGYAVGSAFLANAPGMPGLASTLAVGAAGYVASRVIGTNKAGTVVAALGLSSLASHMGLSFPDFATLAPTAMVGITGYVASKVLKTSKIHTTFVAYLGISSIAGLVGLPKEWFVGHEYWNLAAVLSASNIFLFDLLPKWGTRALGKTLKLNEYIRTRILYNILRIVEDSATGVAILTKDFQIAGSKISAQWNDAVVVLRVLKNQWNRWFGGNAEYIPEFLKALYREFQSLTSYQWSDLFSCFTYPLSSLATDVGRYGLLALSAFWVTPLSFTSPETSSTPFGLSHLTWVTIIGLAAWKSSMTAFKMSRHHEGAQKLSVQELSRAVIVQGLMNRDIDAMREELAHGIGAVGRHLAIESYMQPTVRRGVMMKFVSDDRSPFEVTKNTVRPQRFDKTASDINIVAKNSVLAAWSFYFLYKVIRNDLITDWLHYRNFSSLPKAVVGFWLFYELQRPIIGRIILNYGNKTDDWHKTWEGHYAKNVLAMVNGTQAHI